MESLMTDEEKQEWQVSQGDNMTNELNPAQEKLCEQEAARAYAWHDRGTRVVVLKHILREALALARDSARKHEA